MTVSDSLLFSGKPKEFLKGAAVSHVSKNTNIYNSTEKRELCTVWGWKYCSVKVLVQSSRTPAATVSFFFKPTVLTAAGTLELYFL